MPGEEGQKAENVDTESPPSVTEHNRYWGGYFLLVPFVSSAVDSYEDALKAISEAPLQRLLSETSLFLHGKNHSPFPFMPLTAGLETYEQLAFSCDPGITYHSEQLEESEENKEISLTIRQAIREIAEMRKEMAKNQQEIDHLKTETHIILDKLLAS